jgi:hypothetical protein
MSAEDLATLGVVVFPIMREDERSIWEQEMWDAIDEFPEYKTKGRNAQRVLGGFGAFGNPSSFHHPTIRSFRSIFKKCVTPLLEDYADGMLGGSDGINLESMFDRICVRYEPFQRPGAEGWHRDIYDSGQYKLRDLPATLPVGNNGIQEDIIFGGWTNFDHRTQHFVCLLGTHNHQQLSGHLGFAAFDESEIRSNRFHERLSLQASQVFGASITTNDLGEVIVPPGSSILFTQRIIHCVKSGKQPDTPALRLFHGLRLTKETIPLIPIDHVIQNGGVPRIPSGQEAAMFSKNHYSQFSKPGGSRWRDWGGETFKDVCLFERRTGAYTYKVPGSKDNRNPYANVNRKMPSLSEMGLMSDKFTYTQSDVNVLLPQPLSASRFVDAHSHGDVHNARLGAARQLQHSWRRNRSRRRHVPEHCRRLPSRQTAKKPCTAREGRNGTLVRPHSRRRRSRS